MGYFWQVGLKGISVWDIRNLHIINDSILFYFEYLSRGMNIGSYNLKQEKKISLKEIEVNETHENQIKYFNNGFLMANSQTVTYSYLYQDKIEFMHHDFSHINLVKNDNSKVYIDDDYPYSKSSFKSITKPSKV